MEIHQKENISTSKGRPTWALVLAIQIFVQTMLTSSIEGSYTFFKHTG